MKRFLFNLLCFVVVFFTVEKNNYFLLKYTAQFQFDSRLQSIIEGEINNKEIVVLGSSRGGSNILAKQLTEQTGLESYNLSFPGSNVIFHQFILKNYLKYNTNPRIILYVVDNPTIFSEDSSIQFRYDKLYPVSYHNDFNDMLIKQNMHSVVSKYLYSARLNPANLIFKKKKNFEHRELTKFGSTIFPHYNEDRSWVVPLKNNINNKNIKDVRFNSKTVRSDKFEAFKKIQNLCLTHNIELICLFSPDYKPLNESFITYFENKFKGEVEIYTYNKDDARYYDEQYYFDVSHMNILGAQLFTSEISTFLNTKKHQ